MRYLCLGYLDERVFDLVPDEEKASILKKCYDQCIPFRATGKVVMEESLLNSSSAKSIRPRNGRPSVTDGPFIETKEQLGGFFIVEADSMDEAIQVASLHPAALMGEEFGFGIDVHQIS